MAVVALTGELDAGRDALGGKAWSITEMLRHELPEHLRRLELETSRTFGAGERPLLVSVRSGAPTSMPGMMDTVLNLGMNDTTVGALVKQTGNAQFAWDCYRRFVAMYGEVVMGVVAPSEQDELPFDRIFEAVKGRHRATRDQ